MSTSVAVRARVRPRAEPPFDRLRDPLAEEIARDGPLARTAFGACWPAREALSAHERKRRPLAPELARDLRELHGRLGASAASLDSLERLARGDALCAIAGQQPAPLGGPLYALHKTASAVGLARRVRARTGLPCVPVFWNHAEDSDFLEIRGATVGDAALTLHDLELPAEHHREGGLVGAIAVPPLAELSRSALELWKGLPGHDEVARLIASSLAKARDVGEAHAALLLAWFADEGLVVVDPRLPGFRAAARPVLERYLSAPERHAEAARRAGDWLEPRIGRRPLAGPALDSFVFAIDGDERHKVSPAEARSERRALSPSVALRPVVQDAVLPTAAMACGPGELAYLAQLRGVFEGLEVIPACPVPRLGATWLPAPAVELIEVSGADPWHVVAATDQVLRRHAEARVPASLRQEIEELRAGLRERLEGFAGHSVELDRSFPQLVHSAHGKMDYQLGRIAEGLVAKSRHRMEREHPEWLRLRAYLSPGERLQERRLASLEPAAYRGAAVVPVLCDLAEAHAEELERGEHLHYLLELG